MRPLRVLHVLGAMNRGGVESWLMHVLRQTDRHRFQLDFLVHTDEPATFDDEIISAGSRILRCRNTRQPLSYARRLLEILKREGPFDVLHSHVHHFSGLVLAIGRIAGIPVRVAHSHSDSRAAESGAPFPRRTYLRAMNRLVLMSCTRGLAVSGAAGEALFGPAWFRDRRLSVLYCGIELAPFNRPVDAGAVRGELGLSRDDLVFGHVGRFSPVKNHLFFLQVAASLVKQEPRARFLLVGDGPLRAEIESRADALGLKEKIVFAGGRSDIPSLLIGAMDVFILPSLQEGIPLVIMESQAAGLPCVASDVLTDEALLDPALVRRLPLAEGPDAWARAARLAASATRLSLHAASRLLDGSRFDIACGSQEMCKIYLEEFRENSEENNHV